MKTIFFDNYKTVNAWYDLSNVEAVFISDNEDGLLSVVVDCGKVVRFINVDEEYYVEMEPRRAAINAIFEKVVSALQSDDVHVTVS